MTERERKIRQRATRAGLETQKAYAARFTFERAGRHVFVALGMKEAEVWLEGYEAGLARVFDARYEPKTGMQRLLEHERTLKSS